MPPSDSSSRLQLCVNTVGCQYLRIHRRTHKPAKYRIVVDLPYQYPFGPHRIAIQACSNQQKTVSSFNSLLKPKSLARRVSGAAMN